MAQAFVPTTGAQLRRERVAAGVKAFEVGSAMGVHSSRASQIEALARVPDATAERYRRALAECVDKAAV